jgi:hypothetical protein
MVHYDGLRILLLGMGGSWRRGDVLGASLHPAAAGKLPFNSDTTDPAQVIQAGQDFPSEESSYRPSNPAARLGQPCSNISGAIGRRWLRFIAIPIGIAF